MPNLRQTTSIRGHSCSAVEQHPKQAALCHPSSCTQGHRNDKRQHKGNGLFLIPPSPPINCAHLQSQKNNPLIFIVFLFTKQIICTGKGNFNQGVLWGENLDIRAHSRVQFDITNRLQAESANMTLFFLCLKIAFYSKGSNKHFN